MVFSPDPSLLGRQGLCGPERMLEGHASLTSCQPEATRKSQTPHLDNDGVATRGPASPTVGPKSAVDRRAMLRYIHFAGRQPTN